MIGARLISALALIEALALSSCKREPDGRRPSSESDAVFVFVQIPEILDKVREFGLRTLQVHSE